MGIFFIQAGMYLFFIAAGVYSIKVIVGTCCEINETFKGEEYEP